MKILLKGMGYVFMILALTGALSFTVLADKVETSGECGKKAVWNYDKSKKTLTISGKGAMHGWSTWNEDLDIRKVKIENGITVIGSYSFSYLNNVKKIKLPETVKEIKYSAFRSSGITEAVIGKNVKKIGRGIFSECKKLKKVEWNAKIIPNATFSDCINLKEVKLGKTLKKIGRYAFCDSGIEKLEMPDSVEEIDAGIFSGCKKLSSLKLSRDITGIPSDAFYNTEKLKELDLGKKIREIGEEAFANSGIEKLVLPRALKKIGRKTFTNARSLESIVIKSGVKEIEKYAFENCGVKKLEIPNSVNIIRKKAFANAKELTSIVLSDNITGIRDNTFENCINLSKVYWGDKITNIGEEAFLNCRAFANVSIPKNVRTIEYRAFANSGCQSVVLNDGVKNVDYLAFYDCKKLSAITIGSTVATFQTNAMENCSSLETITVSANNKTFKSIDNCLLNKQGTTLLIVPGTKTGTFTIPEGIQKINSEAFNSCSNISDFSAGTNANYKVVDGLLCNAGGTALLQVPQAKKGTIYVPNGITKIGTSAFYASQASAIVIPNTVYEMAPCAFAYCNNLTYINIPGSVADISQACFWGCNNLKKVTIEQGVKRILRNAFQDCPRLRKVVFPNSLTFINKSSFDENNGKLTFYCKTNSLAMSFAKKYYYNYKVI